MQTFSVNRKPFAVPDYYSVLRSEGFSAFGDAVLAVPKRPADGVGQDATLLTNSPRTNSKGGTTGEENNGNSNSNNAAATVAAALGRAVKGALLIRKFEATVHRPRALAVVTRLLGLHMSLLPVDLPYFLPVVDAYVDSSRREDVYVVTPYMPATLASVLQSGTVLNSTQILFILGEVVQAVRWLHSQGVVVGEIRPEAISIDPQLLGSSGSVRLADFTLCHLREESATSVVSVLDAASSTDLDSPVERIATDSMCYRSPEWALQLTSEIRESSDIWAIGCLLVHLITRRPLWETTTGTAAEYMDNISRVLGYPTDDDEYMVNQTARKAWKSVSSTWTPTGLASVGVGHDSMMRSFLLFLRKLLVLHPAKRLSIEEVAQHPLLAKFTASSPFQPTSANGGVNAAAAPLNGTKQPSAATLLGGVPFSPNVMSPSKDLNTSTGGSAFGVVGAAEAAPTQTSSAMLTRGASSLKGGCSMIPDGGTSWAVNPCDRKALMTTLAELATVIS